MSIVSEFKKFILRGNLLDMAIGFTVGAAFSTVAKSLVNDIIMPPVGWMLGRADFSDLFLLIRPGIAAPPPYPTLAAAQAAGAVTINYGIFLNNILTLLLVAIAMFAIIRFANKAEEALEARLGEPPKPGEPTEKKCEFCRTTIPFLATRCPNCTSQLQGSGQAA